jgi:competence protein ComEA
MSTPAPLSWPPVTSPSWLSQLKQLGQTLWQQRSHSSWLEWSGLGLGLAGLLAAVFAWTNLHQQLQDWIDQPGLDRTTELGLTTAPSPVASSSASLKVEPQTAVTVYVTGAVKKPGVYHLAGRSLFMDAIMAAGGFSSTVWQDYLDQFVNLAQPLTDHQKIWIPKLDQQALLLTSDSGPSEDQTELVHDSPAISPTGGASTEVTTTTASLISINSATSAELMALSGIGEKRAEDIIANRPYQSLTELTTKAKIPASVYQQIQAQLKL